MTAEVPEADGHYEIAELARAVVHFRDRTAHQIADTANADRKVERDAWVAYMIEISERITGATQHAMGRFEALAGTMGETSHECQQSGLHDQRAPRPIGRSTRRFGGGRDRCCRGPD